jgi:uncharacterized protein YyaL (SSP411 family)
VKAFKRAARTVLEGLSARHPIHKEALLLQQIERQRPPHSTKPEQRHLHNAIGWIKRAQDAGKTGGVAWGYRMRRPIRTDLPLGWIGPYPETTGYIISTMLRYADLYDDRESRERAGRMTEWELAIQMPDGGIQGGIYGAQPVVSSTFVTGQVLFGLVDMYRLEQDARLGEAIRRAGEWLLSCLDESGRFVRGYSNFCAPGAKAYETRTGLALMRAGDALDRRDFLDAAIRMAEYGMSCQQPNGWFRENDLSDHSRALTHTIGYVLEGLHGLGLRFARKDFLSAVDRTLDAMLPLIESSGFLAGRWHSDWTPAVHSACLTGSAQLAGVYLRRYRDTNRSEYRQAGEQLLGFVCFTQDLRIGSPGVDGAIRGSYPVSGEYGQWCVLNWATKFFSDSMMDYLAL